MPVGRASVGLWQVVLGEPVTGNRRAGPKAPKTWTRLSVDLGFRARFWLLAGKVITGNKGVIFKSDFSK